MKITGHASEEMFNWYNTVDEEDAWKAAEKLGVFLASVDQKGLAENKKLVTI
jgi:hypothetical protein